MHFSNLRGGGGPDTLDPPSRSAPGCLCCGGGLEIPVYVNLWIICHSIAHPTAASSEMGSHEGRKIVTGKSLQKSVYKTQADEINLLFQQQQK